MKKHSIIIISVTILVIILIYVSVNILDLKVSNQITEYGSIGRDTVLIIGNGKYQIVNSPKELDLIVYTGTGISKVIVSDIIRYKKYNNRVFIVSSEGYAIVYENQNTCVAYIAVDQQKYGGGYIEDELGNVTYVPNNIEDESFRYIYSYDDFTTEEKDIFEEMNKEVSRDH